MANDGRAWEDEDRVGCHFNVEIYAPNGLDGIERTIECCELPVRPWRSGFNGQVILRISDDSYLVWSMDPSTTDYLFGAGDLFLDIDEAERLVRSLSEALVRAGFPHLIRLDTPDDEPYGRMNYQWPADR